MSKIRDSKVYGASTLSIDLVTGVITQSDPLLARDSCTVTLTTPGSHAATNMKLALYRWLGDLGTLVGAVNTFTGSTSYSGSLDTNVEELIAVFTDDIVSVRQFERLDFDVLVYDSTVDYYLVEGTVTVAYQEALAAGTPGTVTPITSGTGTWGNLKLHAGTIYIQSVTDGLWYPIGAAGAGDEVSYTLPGSGGIAL